MLLQYNGDGLTGVGANDQLVPSASPPLDFMSERSHTMHPPAAAQQVRATHVCRCISPGERHVTPPAPPRSSTRRANGWSSRTGVLEQVGVPAASRQVSRLQSNAAFVCHGSPSELCVCVCFSLRSVYPPFESKQVNHALSNTMHQYDANRQNNSRPCTNPTCQRFNYAPNSPFSSILRPQ